MKQGFHIEYNKCQDIDGLCCCEIRIPIEIYSDTRSKYDIDDCAESTGYADEFPPWLSELSEYLPKFDNNCEFERIGEWNYGDWVN